LSGLCKTQSNIMDEIKLGSTVCDKVTGFTGVVTAVCNYLYTSARVEITATRVESDGQTQSLWTDIARVELCK